MKTTEVKIVDRNTPCSINYFIPNGLAKKKKEWLKDKELYEAITNMGPRIVTPVTIYDGRSKVIDKKLKEKIEPKKETEPVKPKKPPKIYMMDAVTGSLYDISTGKCLTSHVLQMQSFTQKFNLHKKLLNLKVDIHRGVF